MNKKIEIYKNVLVQAMECQEQINKMISKLSKGINEDLRSIVLREATPRIKEPITRGKIKSRGIRMEVTKTPLSTTYTIKQRDRTLGTIIIDAKINLDLPISGLLPPQKHE